MKVIFNVLRPQSSLVHGPTYSSPEEPSPIPVGLRLYE